MDVLLSNTPAILLSLWIQKKIGLIRYDYWGNEGKTSIWDWEVWKCQKRFGVFAYMQVFLHGVFVNNFFTMNNLLIPPKHAFPICRLLLWLFFGSIGFREAYEDVRTWNTVERKYNAVQGRFRWLAFSIFATEAFLCWKYRHGTGHIQHDAPHYLRHWLGWVIFYGWLLIHWLYLRFRTNHTTKYPMKQIK